MTQYTWTELEWMWEQDKLEVEKAIQQLIRWGQKNYESAVFSQHRLETQEHEIQTLMQANIRWGIRVEQLEAEVADLTAQVATLTGKNAQEGGIPLSESQ